MQGAFGGRSLGEPRLVAGGTGPQAPSTVLLGRLAAWGALAALLLGLVMALAWLPLRTAMLLTAGLGGGILLLRRPWLVWPLIGATLPFAAAIDVGPASALDVLLAGALALWFLDGVRRRDLRLAHSAPLAAAALYVALVLFSTLRALDFGQALVEVVKWAEFAAVLAIAPVMVWSTGQRHADPAPDWGEREAWGRVRWVAVGIAAGAAAQAALGIYQFVFRIGPDWFVILGRFMRASGSFGQPNPFAGYLGLVLPVVASLALWAWGQVVYKRAAPRQQGSATPGQPLAMALFWSGAAGVIAAGLLASWSRGAWLGAAAALVTIVVLRSRTAALAAAGGALLVGALLLVGSLSPVALQERVPEPVRARLAEIPAFFGAGNPLQQEVTDENFAVIERVAHWVAALRMFEREPWLGVGAGSYEAAYASVRVPRWEEALGHAHNVYLNTLAEVGLVGGLVVGVLWATVLVWLLAALWRPSASAGGSLAAGALEQRALLIGIVGVLVHLAVHSLVDNLFVQGLYVLLALWPAMAAVHLLPRPATVGESAWQVGNPL